MSNPFKNLVAGTALLAVAGTAQAAVVTGNILEVRDAADALIGSTVDHWSFTVNNSGVVTIDTLSWENDIDDLVTDDGIYEAVDVNGDGEIAFVDPYIYLFSDDGSLDVGDLIASNDDSTNTYLDGSISDLDSYLSLSLAAGDYILAFGVYSLSADEAVAGFNDAMYYPVTCTVLGVDCDEAHFDHGDYQITFTGDVTVQGVPEPAALALVCFGLASIGASARKRNLRIREGQGQVLVRPGKGVPSSG